MPNNDQSPLLLKEILAEKNSELQQRFEQGEDISNLLKARSETIDALLQKLWKEAQSRENLNATLVAVGGYGREEMHPASDVDLLILLAEEPGSNEQEALSAFVTQLWDLGLEIGHSVRTLDECVEEAKEDLTVITNLIESRFICGDDALFQQLQARIAPQHIWSIPAFFKAKVAEQQARYKRYGDTAYRVEPNLKEGPGGLRDIQTIGWIVLREFGVRSLKDLSTSSVIDLLSPKEYASLIKARDFLWQVRFVLHQLTGRKTDRLLFDHQRHLAHSFGYTNDEQNQSIESFMQRYYRTITELERLNEIMLGLLREHILKDEQVAPTLINKYYHHQNGYLGIAQDNLFSQQPHTLLEVFHMMQIVPGIKGLTPNTIRALRRNLHLIDDQYRNNPHHKQIFINIMSESQGITFALRRMNRYGLLAAYIPEFANIVGRMQYDLFHAYTVDDHTLNVIRNVRRLSTPKGAEELPFCSKIFKTLHKPMVLYLAALFHDIAKGRGGSHSELGAKDALKFCLSHDLNPHDAETVSWLVKQHLTLSSVAQRQDLSDPEVIQEVAETVITQERLDQLYLLTICDIRGTNPTLLNSWKHSLLKELYRKTRQYLSTGRSHTESTQELINTKQAAVLQQLAAEGIHEDICQAFWKRFTHEYILQHSIESLTWHIKEIANQQSRTTETDIVTALRDNTRNSSSLLFVYAPDKPDVFVKITSAIEQRHLNIVAARIMSSHDGFILDTFNILTAEGDMLSNPEDKQQLLTTLKKNLEQDDFKANFNHVRMPRQLKHFDTPTHVKFSEDKHHEQTMITIRTGDQAGLLTRIGQIFSQHEISIHGAKIATLGEIAEDIFYVTKRNGALLDSETEQDALRKELIDKLSVH